MVKAQDIFDERHRASSAIEGFMAWYNPADSPKWKT
jgi:antibiotic biosynthesis monooxygenase (ABM) superfamily enzyme